MSKWTKERFVEDLRNRCSREIAKIGEKIIEFSDWLLNNPLEVR